MKLSRIPIQILAGRKILCIGLLTLMSLTLASCSKNAFAPASTAEPYKSPQIVKDQYSDSIVTAEIRERIYRIPKNYLPIWDWKNFPSSSKYKLLHGNFHLFYPRFEGYTKELTALMFSAAYNPPSMPTEALALEHMKNMVFVFEILPLTAQEIEQAKNRLESEEHKKWIMEDEEISRRVWSSVIEQNENGLRCISPGKNPNVKQCQGLTKKGELLQFNCDKIWVAGELGACRVNRNSVQEGYAVYYEFAAHLLPHWQEVDATVFAKMKSWEQK